MVLCHETRRGSLNKDKGRKNSLSSEKIKQLAQEAGLWPACLMKDQQEAFSSLIPVEKLEELQNKIDCGEDVSELIRCLVTEQVDRHLFEDLENE